MRNWNAVVLLAAIGCTPAPLVGTAPSDGGSDSGPSCPGSVCAVGERICDGTAWTSCDLGSDGCPEFSTAWTACATGCQSGACLCSSDRDCAAGESCATGSCVTANDGGSKPDAGNDAGPTCPGAQVCTPGNLLCNGNLVLECEPQANGCNAFVTLTKCLGGCGSGTCMCSNDADCPMGESCTSAGSCVPGNGPADGGADAGPRDGGVDAGPACVASNCMPGARLCKRNEILECEMQSSGCIGYAVIETCLGDSLCDSSTFSCAFDGGSTAMDAGEDAGRPVIDGGPGCPSAGCPDNYGLISCQDDGQCPAGDNCCDGYCTQLAYDSANCNACGVSCGVGICVLGMCRGSGGSGSAGLDAGGCGGDGYESGDVVQCGNSCVNLDIDPFNCGTCGGVCRDNEICAGQGKCEPACAPGFTSCLGTCVDLQSDVFNCGGCKQDCQIGAGESCVDGACTCASYNSKPDVCGSGATSFCANFLTDDDNCGMCGHACSTGATCNGGGVCTSPMSGNLDACLTACPSTCASSAEYCYPDGQTYCTPCAAACYGATPIACN